MFLVSLFQWWYTGGWAQKWRDIFLKTSKLAEAFSLGIILQTLFKPWKQITTLEPNSSFIHRAVDSMVSRFVGFWIRLLVLIAGLAYIMIAFLINTFVAIVWPAVPFIGLYFLATGLGVI